MRFFAGLFLTGLLSMSLLAQQDCLASDKGEGGLPADVEKLVQDIVSSKEPLKSERDYRALFKKVGQKGLAVLQASSQDGIAIQAAWEEVRLTVPEKEPAETVRPDRQKLSWFLGFLEGRAHVKAPKWWSEALLDSRANRRDNIYPGKPKADLYHNLGLDNARGPREASLKREGGKVVLRIGKGSVPIPEDLLQKVVTGKHKVVVDCNVSACMIPSRCYVAVHGDVGFPFQLACIDRKTEKVLWKTKVFGTWWGFVTGYHKRMWVTVKEENKRIVVFGSANVGIHVEAFRSEDGRNLFRFSTSF